MCTAAAVGGERVAAITNKGKDGKADKAGAKDKNRPQASNQNEKGQHKHKDDKTIGVDGLITLLRNSVQFPRRDATAPLYFAIDHCFPIKGHGTVLTGTVLSGSVSVNSVIEIPYIQQQRKVKSMQVRLSHLYMTLLCFASFFSSCAFTQFESSVTKSSTCLYYLLLLLLRRCSASR